MNTFLLHILAADQPFFEGECVSVVVPTPNGQYGIMANHTNVISAIAAGLVKFTKADGSAVFASVSDGLVKVENNEVLLLCDSAERPEDIDANRAKRAAEEAKEAILQRKSISEYYSAQSDLARAINRLKIKNGYTKGMYK